MKRRLEIDGLRALAVVPVIWFHSGLPGVPGGFAGVDVFYVISGFLITRIILSDGFSFADFYERRARRLFPALFVMVAATALAGWFVLMPRDFTDFAKSAIAALTFTSNIWFWHAANYFAPQSYLTPLLHTWSLGVEEQFYLLFPAVALLMRKALGRRLVFGFAALWAISLIGCLVCSRWRPEASFYLLPFRGWELLTGAILSMRPQTERALRAPLGVLGLVLLLGAYAVVTEGATYPNAWALLPTLGAALIIASEGEPFRWLLTSAPFLWVGRTSYSLYLWHWPVFALWRYRFEQPPSPAATIGLIAVVVGVSWLSSRFIEEPIRQRRFLPSKRGILIFSAGGAAALGALFVAGVATAGFPSRFPAEIARLDAASYDQDEACSFTRASEMTVAHLCHLGSPGQPKVLFWGDSHAWALRGVFGRAMAADGIPGALASRGGCPPGLGLDASVPPVCSALNRATLDMAEREGIRTIVIAGDWSGYDDNLHAGALMLDGRPAETTAVLMTALDRAVNELQGKGIKVILVDPIPGAKADVPRLLSQRAAYGLELPLDFTVTDYRQANRPFYSFVRTHSGLGRVRLAKAYCNDVECPATVGGASLYIDAHHVRLTSNRGLDVIEHDLIGEAR